MSLVFDKTGTITQGKPQLVSSYTYDNSGATLQLWHPWKPSPNTL